MLYKLIKTEVQNHVYYLILNRDEKRNAFNLRMLEEIAQALKEAAQNEDVKVLVIQARGKVFCAGMDLKGFHESSSADERAESDQLSLAALLDQFNKPSIAVVEGDVIAGGFLFILGCTYVFARKNVRFKLPEIELGLFPFQVMAGLLRVMPEKKALQLCLNTEYFNVEKAISFGIVDTELDRQSLDELIASFANLDLLAVVAGFKATKELRTMEYSKQYDFLLSCLNQLKENSLKKTLEK
ncbi:enoyl-CoA hydratase/isomerase family protein [Sphingobacterium sp. HJSM2_6]|uniref:enoyl-CoA hydratase/isomerase family protein n=1 Tax=Sphingobacterium sp. HJSM2_6 TaxID=3366264 RepID=UPI003BC1B4D8